MKEYILFLKRFRNKIESGEKPTRDELKKLVEIDNLADNDPELKKLVIEVIEFLEKSTFPEIIELKEGEIKEIDKSIIVKRGVDGSIEIILTD